jgi:glycosyltransferase involved in cell wall biosynthesis
MTQQNTEIPEQVVGLFVGDTDPRPVMVTIRCITYNHEAYIRQALEGFVMQKTNFRFEAIVHDDASTDGTAAIIREYAEKYSDIIKPIYETENQYSKYDGTLDRIMNAASRGKYIAFCEGDDYWIDPLKLQKQVDFLDANPEYSMVHTGFQLVDTKSNTVFEPLYEYFREISCSGDALLRLLYFNYILTVSICCRREIIFSDFFRNMPSVMDYAVFLSASVHGNIGYLPQRMVSYRRNPNGAILSGNKRISRIFTAITLYVMDAYLNGDIRKRTFCEHIKIKSEFAYKLLVHYRKNNDVKADANRLLHTYKCLYCLAPIGILIR